MNMPFGQYQGRELEEISSTYLFWLAEILEDPGSWIDLRRFTRKAARDELRTAILDELEFRRLAPDDRLDTVARDLHAREREWLRRLVEAGYRELARQHHPDRGGELRQMQELNDAIDRIRTAIKR